MPDINKINTYKKMVESELRNGILPFWIKHSLDMENGGFHGSITNDLVVDKKAVKGCILNSRILWTFSHAYRIYEEREYLSIADRAYDYLGNYFWDKENSGLLWSLDPSGNMANGRKQIYNLAFGIYGLSEYYAVTQNTDSLEKAIQLFRLIEEHSYDSQNRGYFEALTREWQPIGDLRLSARDMNEKKSMNTHLHVMEAYTNLLRVWDDDRLRVKLKELTEVIAEYIIDPDGYHFKLFFDERWKPKSDHISFGHDIEGSWLLCEAAEVLGDVKLLLKARNIAVKMAEATLAEGVDSDGGILNEADAKGITDSDKHWWPQAEAAVGFLNTYSLTRDERFFEASYRCWEFISKYIVDKKYGEWFWKVSREGIPSNDEPKVGFWKCPYHNSRACCEIAFRLEELARL